MKGFSSIRDFLFFPLQLRCRREQDREFDNIPWLLIFRIILLFVFLKKIIYYINVQFLISVAHSALPQESPVEQ